MKYKCPNCGSVNVVGWREDVIETRYKIKKDGTFYSKPFQKRYAGYDGHEGIECLDCREYVNWADNGYEQWENDLDN